MLKLGRTLAGSVTHNTRFVGENTSKGGENTSKGGKGGNKGRIIAVKFNRNA